MKDLRTKQWELATNIGASSVMLQPNVKKYIYIYIYTKLKIKSPNLELAKLIILAFLKGKILLFQVFSMQDHLDALLETPLG